MLHPAAARGFSRSAAEYERARPGYPPAAIAWLAERLGLGPGVGVLDLAAGTGRLTRLLAATGADVVAELVGSISFVASLEARERESVVNRARTMAGAGEVELRFRCEVQVTTRRG